MRGVNDAYRAWICWSSFLELDALPCDFLRVFHRGTPSEQLELDSASISRQPKEYSRKSRGNKRAFLVKNLVHINK